eukprot:TRINITY_DN5589_c0_g1_i4.p1 TRINITY_DN5589_c0_g1~~TRINITY_DN5589_c0_g1_i4.p1  ORF type:complete len:127 (-),score=46.64 TRINITY_DN5589_c0_g1_i4:278-658(-)
MSQESKKQKNKGEEDEASNTVANVNLVSTNDKTSPSVASLLAEEADIPANVAQMIRGWRIDKVNIANELSSLQRKRQEVKMRLENAGHPRLKKTLEEKMEKYIQIIEEKKKQMENLDKLLSQYNTL